ncbi:MAG TPA: glycosyl hydrolase-related protein [Planctomycetota bacterium]|nr:glycosyl hydrolase-related protein [Planctomycetota bacterium]
MTPIREILVVHHSHFDAGYTHPQPVLWELQRRFIDGAIALCERTADWPEISRPSWTCEVTAPVLHWLERASTRDVDRFAALARDGRIAIGAMLHNLTPLCDAEQIARMLYPLEELRRRLGIVIDCALLHDVNGLPWSAVGLLLDADIGMLGMGINVHYGGYPLRRPLAFRWSGADGRSILAFNGDHYGAFERETKLHEGSLERMAEGLAEYAQRVSATGWNHDFLHLSSSHRGDNAPPDPILCDMVRRWNDAGRTPAIRFATPSQLRRRLALIPAAELPEHAGDWTDWWNFGAASSARETGFNRRTRSRLAAVDLLRAGGAGTGRHGEPSSYAEARRHFDLYHEHTWGAAGSVAAPDEDNTHQQWIHKAWHATSARALSGLAFDDVAERHVGNPAFGGAASGLLLVNPAPVARRAVMRAWGGWFDGSWRHHAATAAIGAGEDWPTGWLKDHQRLIGPVDLPANGWASFDVAALPAAAPDAGVTITADALESPTHRLRFDRVNGRVLSLVDKRTGHEVIDAASPWSFFGYVQERVDPARHAIGWPVYGRHAPFREDWERMYRGESCWDPEWPALRRGPERLIDCAVEHDALGATLVMRWAAPGCDELETRIGLGSLDDRVRCVALMRKADVREYESICFTFPLALDAGWRAHFDTAGAATELDAEQLPGASRDWVTVDRWAAMHDARACVALACIDAPLVQLGAFNVGKGQKRVERPAGPLLVAWPANNLWTTNFRASQPGRILARYELATMPAYDAAACARFGDLACAPIEVHPIIGDQRPSGEVVVARGDGVRVLAIKPAEDGDGVIVRVTNAGARAAQALLTPSGFTLGRAMRCSTLEEAREAVAIAGGAARIDLAPRAIATIRLAPRR